MLFLNYNCPDLSSTVSVLEKSTVVTARCVKIGCVRVRSLYCHMRFTSGFANFSMKDIMVTDKNPINVHPVVSLYFSNEHTADLHVIIIIRAQHNEFG